ncbi:ras-related protein Rab-1A-like [Dermacentor albipictus]|uniref:ras-related protein Rab-1A-like n=1 Tax=Dermacentor albipictus TaxID=60249 RepID=UPI0038FCF76B
MQLRRGCLLSTMNEEHDTLLNIVVLGERWSGKTSLLLRFAEGYFSENQRATVGIEYKMKVIEIDGRRIMLNLADTMGQERFHSIAAMFYRGADGIIVTYDVTNQASGNCLAQMRLSVLFLFVACMLVGT